MKLNRLMILSCCVLILASGAMTSHIFSQSAPAIPQIVIDGQTTRQQIDGFGAAFAWQAPFLKDLSEPSRSAILDTLFSQQSGAGLSIVRSMINCSNDRTYPEFMTISPAEGVWEFDHDTGQIWLMQQAKMRGATRAFSSVWSPPAWMKTNKNCINVIVQGIQSRPHPPIPQRSIRPSAINDIDTRGKLDPSKRQAFADYLSRYVREYKARFGLTIYAISIANEPEFSIWYDSSLWTAEELRDFIRDYLTPTFARDGVDANVIIPETGAWNAVTSYAGATLRDAEAAVGVQIVAGHHYGGDVTPFDKQLIGNRRVWQTEVSNIGTDSDTITDTLRWAKDIHDFMTVAESNAWLWWWGGVSAESGSSTTSGEGLVYFSENGSYRVAKRLYGIGNYSRFVRPGYLRIKTSANPTANVFLSAYKDPATQRFVAVAINSGTVSETLSLAVDHLPLRAVTPYVTSANQNLAPQNTIPLTNGVFTATLAARSVTTFVTANNPDLYILDPTNLASKSPAIQIVNSDGFQSAREHLPTSLPALNDLANWSFGLGDANGDGTLDLYAIGTTNTNSGSAELHILNGADSFKTFLGHFSLTLPNNSTGWSFIVGDANGDGTPDLYAIDTTNPTSGNAELHIANGADSFKTFLGHYPLALPPNGAFWRFGLADANGDGTLDLYALGTIFNGTTAVQIFDGTAAYSSTLTDAPIALPLALAPSWRVAVADANGDGIPDLYLIDATGAPIVHILNGAQAFQTELTTAPIPLPLTGIDLSRVFLVGRR